MKLRTTSDVELKHVSALVHGDSKVGKTTSIKTLPESSTFIICSDRSSLPLRNRDYKIVQVESWEDVQETHRWFTGKLDGASDEIREAVGRCRTIVVDSLSEVSALLMQHIIGVLRPSVIFERSEGKRKTPENAYASLLTREDYMLHGDVIIKLVNAFTHLPYHVIFTSNSAWSKDHDSNNTIRTPDLPNKAAQKVVKCFDVALHMAADPSDPTDRLWRTVNNDRILCGDSTGVLDEFEKCDWTKLFTKLLAETKEKTNGTK